MLIVPARPLASQTFAITIAGQNLRLNIYQKSTGLFMDVLRDEVLLIGGVICQNLNRIVRSAYFGFTGDLVWLDMEGSDDPSHTGLGSRWLLLWLAPNELPLPAPQLHA